MAGILDSKVVLAIAENESPNWGGEVGFAYAHKTPVLALMREGHEIPLILAGMMTDIIAVPNLNNIESYIELLEAKIRKYIAT